MSNVVTIARQATLEPAGRTLDTLIRKLSSRLEPTGDYNRFSISTLSAPTPGERQSLERRQAELNAALMPGDPKRIGRVLMVLRARFADRQKSKAEMEAEIALAIDVFTGFPDWAVARVCDEFARGIRAGGDFAPPANKIAIAVRDLLAPIFVEKEQIQRVLNATVYTGMSATERERANVLAEKLQEECKQWAESADTSNFDRDRKKAERKQRAVEADLLAVEKQKAVLGINDDLPISSGLRAKLEAMGASFNQGGDAA